MNLLIVNVAGLSLIALIIWWFWIAKIPPGNQRELEQGHRK